MALTEEQKAALKATADAMSAPGKGFLASDESAGPWLRAGHVEAKKIPDTAENRAAYRSMLYKTAGLSEYISGVILHWETLFQNDADGKKMVDLITGNGMIPGIKLDKVLPRIDSNRIQSCRIGEDAVQAVGNGVSPPSDRLCVPCFLCPPPSRPLRVSHARRVVMRSRSVRASAWHRLRCARPPRCSAGL